jgi:uncharacterized protein
MKLYFFLLVIIITMPKTLFSQDTLVIYFDKDWNKISNKDVAVYYRNAFIDSNKTWIVNDYYMSKQIQKTGSYKSKKLKTRQGHFIYYYENGKLESEGKYSTGNREGDWIYYYDNGEKKAEGIYIASLAEGIWEYWHESGEKKAEGKYYNDNKEGIWNYWYTNGQLKNVETYTKGEITSIIGYFENGKINYKGDYIKEVKQGEWTYWNVDGRIFFKGAYTDGNQDGEWIRYFPEGDVKIFYVHGVPQGKTLGGMVISK